jgi:hypothetical protein
VNVRPLIRLYPERWRERYGEEFAALVASEPPRVRLVLDVLVGALDAWLAPQSHWAGAATRPSGGGGGGSVMRILTCRSSGLSPAEQVRGAVLLIAATVAISASYIAVNRMFGENLWLEALGIAVFPFALVIATLQRPLRRHALATRLVLGAILFALVYLLSLAGAWL